MNCRRLAVIAAAFTGLVPVTLPASAQPTAHHSATATATILQLVKVKDVTGKGGSDRSHGAPERASRRFIDQDGFITAATNPKARVIYIVDLP